MRILLAIGFVSVAVIVAWGVVTAIIPDTFSRVNVDVGPVSFDALMLSRIIAVAVPVIGLAWMIRIFRRSRAEPPPPWRYRDR